MSEQTARNKPAPAPSWVSRLVRLLVLLVLIGSGAAGYIYVWPEVAAFQAKQAEVEQNLASLAKADQSLANNLTALIDTKVKMSENATSAALQSTTTRLSAELDSIRDIEQRAAGTLNEANQLLYRMSKIDQSAWRRAEATFNIRLAGQRLQFAEDVRGALTLLSQADTLLKSDSGEDVGAIRSAIAFDRTQLRAVEKLDMVGLMGRLSALDRQIQTLDLSALDPSVRDTGTDAISITDTGETSADTSLSLSLWEQAIDTLASYFVITELESPQQKPSTSDWSRFAALSMKLNLEQARVALLIRDSESFTDSLARAEVILAELLSSNDDPAMVAVIEELAALSSLSLRLELPGLETLKLINDERVEGADATNSSVLFSTDSGDNPPGSIPE
jgi:uroporphyrin-3 C-methyltransferase